jgi:Zn-dependent oligopeptidase
MANPLISYTKTPNTPPPFSQIENKHFKPGIEELIEMARKEIQAIKATENPNFELIEQVEAAGKRLDRASSVFFNLNSAETNDEIQALAREISPMLTEYSNDILLDQDLFELIKEVFDKTDKNELSPEQWTLLDKTYKGFKRNGALLDDAQKKTLREIDVALAQKSLQFGENVLAETNKYELVIDDKEDLDGLPDFAIAQAAETANEKGYSDKWVITLQYPSYVPFMTYAKNRELRKELAIAFGTRAFKGDELDNREIVKEIVALRHQRANLLGYPTHADFILEERMAESPIKVMDFLREIERYSKDAAQQDVDEVAEYAKKTDGIEDFQRWDFAYYSEKLKMEKYAIDDELLKPYFQLEKVIDGVFQTAHKLFGIQFIPNKSIDVYHEDVMAYDVMNEEGQEIAKFYADFFPRAGKRAGAWMTSFAGQYKDASGDHRPLVSIVCNFTKPSGDTPSLLTFNEVTTLFHEFGHALHGMLANGTYESLSGTSVYWDFVELPSQIFENWCYEKECLDLFAKHYKTGESIPQEYIDKIVASSNFMEGYQTLRQLSFGMLDMAWHGQDPNQIEDVAQFEEHIMNEFNVLPALPNTNMSCSFSHIFQGGYSAGYYSYKWAEVLDADAFEFFKEKGIFNEDVANAFQINILATGGSEHPSKLYKRFRGKEADVKALLRRAGLIKT